MVEITEYAIELEGIGIPIGEQRQLPGNPEKACYSAGETGIYVYGNKCQQKYKEAAKSLEQIQVKGSGTKIDGIYYYVVSDPFKSEIQETLKKHLQIAE